MEAALPDDCLQLVFNCVDIEYVHVIESLSHGWRRKMMESRPQVSKINAIQWKITSQRGIVDVDFSYLRATVVDAEFGCGQIRTAGFRQTWCGIAANPDAIALFRRHRIIPGMVRKILGDYLEQLINIGSLGCG